MSPRMIRVPRSRAHWRYLMFVAAGTVARALRPCRVPIDQRCVMGSPVHPAVRCPRESKPGTLWCAKHTPTEVTP